MAKAQKNKSQNGLLERIFGQKLSLTRNRASSMVCGLMNLKAVALFTLLFWGMIVTEQSAAPFSEAEIESAINEQAMQAPTNYLEASTRSYLLKHMKDTPFQKVCKLSKLIVKLSKQGGLPVGLILSVIRVESGFQAWAVSSKGAVGLMQLMPDTAEWLAPRIGMRWQGPVMLLDEETNVRMGIKYLSLLKSRYQGDLKKVLSAYNQGPGKVDEDVQAGKSIELGYHEKIKNYFPKIAYGERLW